MEITLDLAYVQQILRSERAATSGDLRRSGVQAALAASQQRHDERIAAAADVGTLACRPGCTWCCHFTVDVRAAEVFRILEFVERTFAADETRRVLAEIRANSAALGGLDQDARVTRNLKCPFLAEERCTIYVVRPQSCRNYHATDAAGCERSYEEPDNLDIDPEFAPMVYQAGAAHVEAFSDALESAGLDTRVYELNTALAAATADAGARGRFESGGRPFTGLDGDAVAKEFDDLS